MNMTLLEIDNGMGKETPNDVHGACNSGIHVCVNRKKKSSNQTLLRRCS